MSDLEQLATQLQNRFVEKIANVVLACDELTLEISRENLREVCIALRDEADYKFEMLIDLCGVDYIDYGIDEWVTEKATGSGFERGVERERKAREPKWTKSRFAVVYHLLSIKYNQRLRLRVLVDEAAGLLIDSVTDIWPAANWFEREAFDLFGIVFNGHPDLRRILTDYGFIGHPFRKDFPLIGNVEVRYDATLGRVIYEPVSIESRTLVPKVIRNIDYTSDVPVVPPAQGKANG
jgi:NADH-quinone oxidoreductase subunit C